MEDDQDRDIETLPGERWFPDQTSFRMEMEEHWGDWGVKSEVDRLEAVLLRRPGEEIENADPGEFRFKEKIDPVKFRSQHQALVELYEEKGVDVHYISRMRPDRPNGVFVRDLFFMTPEGAVVGRPGMSNRRGEERFAAQALSRLGVPIIKTVSGEGIFEGANAFWVDSDTVILGLGSRTNRSGYEQVKSELERQGVENILTMQIPYGNAHIDGLLNMPDHDLAVIHAPQVPYEICAALRCRNITILEAPSRPEVTDTLGINFVPLEPGLVVQPEGNPRTRELLENHGVEVLSLDFSEILKAWGAVHCVTGVLKRG